MHDVGAPRAPKEIRHWRLADETADRRPILSVTYCVPCGEQLWAVYNVGE